MFLSGGVCELLNSLPTSLGITVSKLCVRDLSKTRDFTIPSGTVVVDDVSGIEKETLSFN